MKNHLFPLLAALLATCAHAQQNTTSANLMPDAVQVSAGYSTHGTGDAKGVFLDFTWDNSLNRRFDWSNSLGATIHSGTIFQPIVLPEKNSYYFTTAGLQWASMTHFNVLGMPEHKLRIGAGVVARYESSSQPKVVSLYDDPEIFPDPFFVINDAGVHQTLAVGYIAGVSYLAQLSPQWQAGLRASFQNDTNGAAILQLGVTLGRFIQ